MSVSDISLTSAMRDTLVSMQTTANLLSRTQNRLSTGKKVNSALDNPVNFFTAQAHSQRASDLSGRKDGMLEAIQGVRAANAGITGLTSLIESAKGLTQSARSSDREGRNTLAAQFNTILDQMDAMVTDSQYKGKNFLAADSLQVLFNENGSSLLTIQGFDASTAGMSVTGLTVGTADVTQNNINTVTNGVSTAATTVHAATANATAGTSNVLSGTFFVGAANSVAGGGSIAGVGIASSIVSGMTAASTTGAGNTGGLGVFTTGLLVNVSQGLLYSGTDTVGNIVDIFRTTGVSASGINAAQAATAAVNITNLYINGTVQNATDYTVTSGNQGNANTSGQLIVYFGANVIKAGMTGLNLNITYDLAITSHAANSNGKTQPNIYVYDLAGTDVASGATIDSMGGSDGSVGYAGTTGKAGMQVFVSGALATTGSYYFSGKYLLFNTTAPPTTSPGAIEYNYNNGFSQVNGAAMTFKTAYTGTTLGAGQTLTDVKINGFAATEYRVSGGDIVFSGTDTSKVPQLGDTITFSVVTAGSVGSWDTDAGITNSIDRLDAALTTLRNASTTMGSTQNIIDIRKTFTDNFTAELLKGADNLTLADMNEEGANMLMLQTRQTLGTTSLKMASDSAQAILRLF